METLISLMHRMSLGQKFGLSTLLLALPGALLLAVGWWPQYRLNLHILAGVSAGMALLVTIAFYTAIRRSLIPADRSPRRRESARSRSGSGESLRSSRAGHLPTTKG